MKKADTRKPIEKEIASNVIDKVVKELQAKQIPGEPNSFHTVPKIESNTKK